MNRIGVLLEEVYLNEKRPHFVHFPSSALSASGNMGIISA